MKEKNGWFVSLSGLLIGFINGLFGSGGGIIAVKLLERSGLKIKESHATSLAVILPLSVLSAWLYCRSGETTLSQALPYIPASLIGALAGGFLIKRIKTKTLRVIFALVIIGCAVRMFF